MKRFTGTVKTVGVDKLPDVSPLNQPQKTANLSTTNLNGVLAALRKKDGSSLLNTNEITTLSNLTFDNGEKILDMNDRYFIYEIVNVLYELGYDKTYEYLNNLKLVVNLSKREMLFDNPLLTPAKDKLALDMEIFRNKVDVTHGDVDCRKCGSDNTISVQKQMRSADEPMTTFVTCQQCGNKWKE
jgi:DNA-directed RNA polymerase subunit M/transcription elongation factor TFIIS